MDHQRTYLVAGSIALVFLGLLTPLWFGIVYGASGVIGGLAIILALIVVQYPLMRVVRKLLPPIERNESEK